MSNSTLKKVAAVLAIILAVLMIVPVFVTILTGSATAAVTQADLKALKDEANKLANEKNKIEKELKNIRSNKQSAIKEKTALDNQITLIQAQVDNSTEIIQALSAQIAEKEQEVLLAEQAEAEEFELFKKRVRAMEENKSASYWGVILRAESFSELLSRVEVINDIIEYDKILMAELKAIRESIETAKAECEADKQEQDLIKADLERTVLELEARYAEQNDFIKTLEAKEDQSLDDFEEALKEMERVNKEVAKMAAELAKQSKYVGGTYLWPAPGYYTITSPYGNRFHPVLKKNSFHTGTDVGAPQGASVLAANSGSVIVAGWNNAYGNYIVINHGGGQTTLYAHLSKILTKKGANVKRGEKIGLVGSTGWSTGPHLHFEISKDGKTTNPMSHFKKMS